MKLCGAFVYLGIDTFHSEKLKKNFKSACFLQGTDVQKVFLNDESEKLLKDIIVGQAVSVELDIKTGQNTFVSLLSVVHVNSANSANSDKQKTA